MYYKNVFTLFLLLWICAGTINAQTLPPESEQPIVEPIKLSGPRVGFTYIAPGTLADRLADDWDAHPFITQFGWQFETKYFALDNGTAGLIEAIVLVGGLEQELFLPSASLLIGVRNAKGFEFGFGPNIAISGPSFVFAVGSTIQSGYLNFPINFALAPSRDGARFSLLFGFTSRKR